MGLFQWFVTCCIGIDIWRHIFVNLLIEPAVSGGGLLNLTSFPMNLSRHEFPYEYSLTFLEFIGCGSYEVTV